MCSSFKVVVDAVGALTMCPQHSPFQCRWLISTLLQAPTLLCLTSFSWPEQEAEKCQGVRDPRSQWQWGLEVNTGASLPGVGRGDSRVLQRGPEMFTVMHCFVKQISLCFSSFDISHTLLAYQLVHLVHKLSVYSRTKNKLIVLFLNMSPRKSQRGDWLKIGDQGLPWQSSGWDTTLPLQGEWVRYLVGELRSHRPQGVAKNRKRNWGSMLFPT